MLKISKNRFFLKYIKAVVFVKIQYNNKTKKNKEPNGGDHSALYFCRVIKQKRDEEEEKSYV